MPDRRAAARRPSRATARASGASAARKSPTAASRRGRRRYSPPGRERSGPSAWPGAAAAARHPRFRSPMRKEYSAVGLETGRFDDRAPALVVALEDRGELGGSEAGRLEAEALEPA